MRCAQFKREMNVQTQTCLISTPLRRGGVWDQGQENRFSCFWHTAETDETVYDLARSATTPLKRGVNGSAQSKTWCPGKDSGKRLLALTLAAAVLVAGCASKDHTNQTTQSPRSGTGIAEYRQVATNAQAAVRAALASLATVSAQTNRCGPDVLSAFSAEVRRLQVESIQLRARSEAMQARGDAYFDHWHERLARIQDPEVRSLAQQNRTQLQQSFAQIKQLSQSGREAFKPFVSGLRQLRNALEHDPASLSGANIQSTISSTREQGQRVEQCLAGIERELDSMSAVITPAGKTRAAVQQGLDQRSATNPNSKTERAG